MRDERNGSAGITNRALRGCAAVVSALLAVQPAASADGPPLPDPKHPVDYVRWLVDTYGQGDNAYDNEPADAIAKRFGSWTEAETATVAGWVDANHESLKLFVEASKARKWSCRYVPESGALLEIELKWTPVLRGIARVALARARLRMSMGDTTGAIEDVRAVLRCARHVASLPMTIPRLVAVALDAGAIETMTRFVRDRAGGDAAVCRALLALLQADGAPLPGLDGVIEFERVTLLDCAQRFLRDVDGDGAYERLSDPPEALGVPQIPPLRIEQVIQQIDAHSDRLRALASEPAVSFRKAAEEIEAQRKRSANALLRVCAPNLARVVELDRRGVALGRSMRLILRLHIERAASGRWPAGLREAAGTELADCCIDPFSGQDFVYRVKDGQPLLYSVGENGVDDGGQRPAGKTWAADGDAILWPLEHSP